MGLFEKMKSQKMMAPFGKYLKNNFENIKEKDGTIWNISQIMRGPFGRRSKHEICIGQLIPSFEAGRGRRRQKS